MNTLDIDVYIAQHNKMIVLSFNGFKRKYIGYSLNAARNLFKAEYLESAQS